MVCGLRAGRTMKEIISYRNIKKRALFKMLKESLKNLSLLRICWGSFNRKKGNRSGRQPRRAHHQGPQQVSPPPGCRRWTFPEQIWEDSVKGCTYIAGSHHFISSRTALLPKTARGWRTGSRRALQRCGCRRSGLLGLLTATLLTFFCGASLN